MTSVFFWGLTMVGLVEGQGMAWAASTRWENSHSAWNPPVWPLRLCVPIGAILLILQGVVKLIDDLTILFSSDSQRAERAGTEG